MKHSVLLSFVEVVVLVGLLPVSTNAQAVERIEPVVFSVRRLSDTEMQTNKASAYVVAVEFRNMTEVPVEVAVDRRLIQFQVRGLQKGRRFVCKHINKGVARRKKQTYLRVLGPKGTETAVWREWTDLRMYCWGKAFRLLEQGASVQASITRSPWIALSHSDRKQRVRKLESSLFVLEPHDAAGTETQLQMSNIDRNALRGATAHVTLRSDMRTQVYLRPDLFRFKIYLQDSVEECTISRTRISPIQDFFRTLGARGISQRLDLAQYCRGLDLAAGVYEIEPSVDLLYGGPEFKFKTLTGTVVGKRAYLRIRPPRQYEIHSLK